MVERVPPYSFVDLFSLLLCQPVQRIRFLRGAMGLCRCRRWSNLLILLRAFGASVFRRCGCS